MRLRYILDDAAEASWNMAVDEALLVAGGAPTLRLYGWSPHAVSLGWFQRAADFDDLPAGTTIVRRLTGGGAIHHGDEITFALTADTHVLPRDIEASYRLLHEAAIAALSHLGVHGRLCDVGDLPGARPAERWCFGSPGRNDVVTGAGKLLGSAQRRIAQPRPRVLHHGSIVLQRPSLTPFVAAAADEQPADAAFADALRRQLVERIAAGLGLEPEAGSLSPEERDLADRLRGERYRNPAFLRRR